MSELYETIDRLCKSNNKNMTSMCKEAKVSRGALTDLKMGRTKTLSTESLNRIAEYFGVSFDYLLGNDISNKNTPTLTKKDERDISKRLHETLEDLEHSQDGLMFDGEPLDDITKELLMASLRNGLEISKKIAKEKYTPHKYR